MSETVNPVITVEMLRDACACDEQEEKFIELFGDQVEVSEETAVKHADVFDWRWAADTFLYPPGHVLYQAAMAAANTAFRKAAEPSRDQWNRARAAAREEYENTTGAGQGSAWSDDTLASIKYRRAIDAAHAERHEAQKPFSRALKEAQARTFARAFRAQHAETVD